MPDFVLMERLIGEDLDDYVELRNETMSFWTKICLLINVVKGIRHFTSIGIVHLDLKPINILVCKFMITKIIDFGEAYHPSVCQKGITFFNKRLFPRIYFSLCCS
jgi:serine/threonine protein kinase